MCSAGRRAWLGSLEPQGPARCRCSNYCFCRIRRGDSNRRKAGVCRSSFGIVKPAVHEGLAVGIVSVACIECYRFPNRGIDHNRRGSALAVYIDYRIVVCVAVVVDRPIHACCEIVLKRLAPAPYRCLIRNILPPIVTFNRVLRSYSGKQVAALCLDRMCFAIRLPVNVAPAPTAPVWSAERI